MLNELRFDDLDLREEPAGRDGKEIDTGTWGTSYCTQSANCTDKCCSNLC